MTCSSKPPTREDVKRLLTDHEGLKGAYWDELAIDIAESYLRALDVVDAAELTPRNVKWRIDLNAKVRRYREGKD